MNYSCLTERNRTETTGKERLLIRRKTAVSFVCVLGLGQHLPGIGIEDAPNVLKPIIEPK